MFPPQNGGPAPDGVRGPLSFSHFRKALLRWYDRSKRDLAWRRTTEFYPVWLSEIMLQQTRVEAVTPYFERFLEQFPDVAALAHAQESRVLAAWAGLGYYSRARNLHRAAKSIARDGAPGNYEVVRALPGVGDYTAAAISSIVLGEARAAVDGNVMRVISRIASDPSDIRAPETKRRFAAAAARLLDRSRPGDFNQAMMELGATVCTPKSPRCIECPVMRWCAGQAAGTAAQLPVKLRRAVVREIALDVAIAMRNGAVLLVQRAAHERRLAGFHELPLKSDFKSARFTPAGEFTHQIVNDRFRVRVWRASGVRNTGAGEWMPLAGIDSIPVTTISRKALSFVFPQPEADSGASPGAR